MITNRLVRNTGIIGFILMLGVIIILPPHSISTAIMGVLILMMFICFIISGAIRMKREVK